jgi:hypothetical protein
MCNPFRCKFRIIPSANLFKMVCFSACIFTTEAKGHRVDPGRYLAQLGWRWGAWKLERAVCIGCSGRGASDCEPLSISIPIIIIRMCDIVADPSLLRMSSRFLHVTFWPWLPFALFLNNCTQSTADSTAVIFTSCEKLPFQTLFKNIGKRLAFQ